jgi:hypothetical protein
VNARQRLARYAAALALLLSLAFGFYAVLEALGPRGFSFRDETFCFHQALSYRAGYPWLLTWANGNLLKLCQFKLYALSGSFQALHVPSLLAVALEAASLYFIGRRLGGPRVGQGAFLAALLSATALVQARSLLPFATLPGLLALSVALAFRRKEWAFLGGLLLASGFLDYEATAFALPGAAAFFYFEPRLKRSAAHAWALGVLVGIAAVLWVSRHSLADWWTMRTTYNAPLQASVRNPMGLRFWRWFFGGQAEAYLGVSGHGTFALWALPLAFVGLAWQGRRRAWLPLWLAGALLALVPSSQKFEPQRALAAVIPLALAAGFGWRWLWQQARSRTWLALLALALPLFGLWQEIHAFEASMLLGQRDYQRSQAWLALAKDPTVAGKVDAALLPLGLTWESALGSAANPHTAPLVWVPTDLDRDAPAGQAQVLHYPDGSVTGDLLLALPETDPLRQDLAWLRPFWLRISGLRGQREPAIQACRSALQAGLVKTPLARAAVWDKLLDDAIQSNRLTVDDLKALDQEAFRSPFFYRARMIYTWPKDLRLTRAFCALLARHSGADKLTEDERGLLAIPWDQVAATPHSPAWPAFQ